MKDQTAIKDSRGKRVGLLFRKHVQEIGGVRQVVTRLDRILALTDQLEGRHHRWNLGNQPDNSVINVLRIINGPTGIKSPNDAALD